MAKIPMPGPNEFDAHDEQLMRQSQRKAREDDMKAARPSPPSLSRYQGYEAQKARDNAAKTMRNSRAMPDAFPVGGEPDE